MQKNISKFLHLFVRPIHVSWTTLDIHQFYYHSLSRMSYIICYSRFNLKTNYYFLEIFKNKQKLNSFLTWDVDISFSP